jgi:threonine/homoserine/homoserine lactone efflux protein
VDHSALLAYFVAVMALTAAPGPLVAVLAARAVGRDTRGASAFAAGLCLGDVIAVLAVAMGVGLWAEAKPELFALAKYAGVCYLLWLSVRIWNDVAGPSEEQIANGSPIASLCAGTALCLGNPSTILIYMLLLPGVAPAGVHGAGHLATLVAITFAAVAIVFFGAILLARQVNRIVGSQHSSTILSRATAATIAVTSIWILAN